MAFFLRQLILGFMILWLPAGSSANPLSAHVAVIDAGSSGSRIYLYKTTPKGSTIEVEDVWGSEPKDVPGLSEFKEQSKDAYDAGIVPLLLSLRTELKEMGLKESEVTLHVLATGGLRALEPVQSEAILASVSAGIKTTEFKRGHVAILPSELEGVLAWADLNNLMGRLSPGKETLGIVEVGGASSQIAYEVKGKKFKASKSWRIQGHSYRVSSRSFLGLGQNAARKSMIHSVGGGVANNPCYPEGVSVTDKKTAVDALTGSFDGNRCRSLYREVIRGNKDFTPISPTETMQHKFAGIGQGNPVGPIKGSISLWKLRGNNPHDSLKVIEVTCKAPWSKFREQFGGELANQNQCANSIFIETLLYDPKGLGLNGDQVKHIETVGGRIPSWTRGLLLLPDSELR